MTTYILRRVVHLIPVLLLVSAAVFFIFRIVPGDIATARLGEDATDEAIAELRAAWGLDRPVYLQYLDWLGGVVRGDFGESYSSKQPVMELLLEKLPVTVQLAIIGIGLSLILAVPLGILAALYRGSWLDHFLRLAGLLGFCMPRYWLAILLILVFAIQLRWLPPAGYVDLLTDPVENLKHVALPALSVALTLAAVQMRFLRSSLLEVLSHDFVRTAHAKGLAQRVVVLRHALKNSLIPFVTIVGLELGALLGGLVVVEQIFAWPGIGWLTIQAIIQRDYAVVQGAVLMIAFGYVMINLIVDIAYAYLDPRIRYT